MQAKTVGELKKVLETLPDDAVLVDCTGACPVGIEATLQPSYLVEKHDPDQRGSMTRYSSDPKHADKGQKANVVYFFIRFVN